MKNKYEIRGDVTVIFIPYKTETYETLIDTEDLSKAEAIQLKFKISKLKDKIYALAQEKKEGKRTYHRLHRIVMDCPNNRVVDHINHDTLDNRKSNLRVVTQSENLQNLKGPRRSDKYLNVYWIKEQGIWRVNIQHNDNMRYFGYYHNYEEACEVAKKARAILLPYSKEASQINIDANDDQVIFIKGIIASTAAGIRTRGCVYYHKKRNIWRVRIRNGRKDIYEKGFKFEQEARLDLVKALKTF